MAHTYVAAPAVDKKSISYLFENLDFILNNKQKILFHKEYKNIKIPGVFVGGLYVGMYEMSIGDLLILWDKTEWHTGTCYYYNIIGTPLSGMNNACWYDIKKGEHVHTHNTKTNLFSRFYFQELNLVVLYLVKRVQK